MSENAGVGEDALVGLRFEVSGGLGRMSGRILGKTGGLYLVRREGAEHLELLSLDDLRSAKFYDDLPPSPPVASTTIVAAAEPSPTAVPAAAVPATTEPPTGRRRLADQIRKRLGAG